MFNRKHIFKGSIFHCYVSLPECNFRNKIHHGTNGTWDFCHLFERNMSHLPGTSCFWGGTQNRAATKCPESHWIRLPSMGNAVHEFQTGIGSPFRIWNHLGVSTQVMSKWKDIYNSKIHISHHWIDMSIIFIKIFQPFHLYNFPAYVVFFRLSVSCNEPYFWSFNHSVAMVKMVPPPQVFWIIPTSFFSKFHYGCVTYSDGSGWGKGHVAMQQRGQDIVETTGLHSSHHLGKVDHPQIFWLHPGRLTWNTDGTLRIHPRRRIVIFQTIIFRFYVSLRGCISEWYLSLTFSKLSLPVVIDVSEGDVWCRPKLGPQNSFVQFMDVPTGKCQEEESSSRPLYN